MKKNAAILRAGQTHCAAFGHRFTEPRRHVLAILEEAGKPMGAYDIKAAMPTGTQPPTVYRALEFWQREGFIHNISSLNLYAACHAEHRHQGSQFAVCDDCGRIEEVHLCRLPRPLQSELDAKGFRLTRWNAELHGLCTQCQA